MNTDNMRKRVIYASYFNPWNKAKEHRILISICIFAGSMFILSDIHLENEYNSI